MFDNDHTMTQFATLCAVITLLVLLAIYKSGIEINDPPITTFETHSHCTERPESM